MNFGKPQLLFFIPTTSRQENIAIQTFQINISLLPLGHVFTSDIGAEFIQINKTVNKANFVYSFKITIAV